MISQAFIVSHNVDTEDFDKVWKYCSPALWWAHLTASSTLFFGAFEAVLQLMITIDTNVTTLESANFRFFFMKINSVVLTLLNILYLTVYTTSEINICSVSVSNVSSEN